MVRPPVRITVVAVVTLGALGVVFFLSLHPLATAQPTDEDATPP